MNWKKEAMDKLERLGAMRQAMQSIPLELQRLEEEALRLRSAGLLDVHVSGGGGREDMLLSNLVQRQELERLRQQTRSWLVTVEKALSVLSPEEKLVLDRLFITPGRGGLDELCRELVVEKSSIYRKRDSALRRFTHALYGFEDS